eukprot:GHUV01040656.1.p2 GENE.GHUV01040656.1~~GHUV01040656.1.p2  ORF type:complete len:106 (+),score=28.90 GHUV01040656.1:259-576(+)
MTDAWKLYQQDRATNVYRTCHAAKATTSMTASCCRVDVATSCARSAAAHSRDQAPAYTAVRSTAAAVWAMFLQVPRARFNASRCCCYFEGILQLLYVLLQHHAHL